MQGNPYSSAEPGLGPLMRDIKNKICQDVSFFRTYVLHGYGFLFLIEHINSNLFYIYVISSVN